MKGNLFFISYFGILAVFSNGFGLIASGFKTLATNRAQNSQFEQALYAAGVSPIAVAAVYDYKFGNARLSNSRIEKIRRAGKINPNVPIIEIRPQP